MRKKHFIALANCIMNTTTTPHTPTPWTIGEDNDVFGAEESFCVARMTNAPDNDPEGVANAQHIVHCVNTHAALVQALSDLLSVMESSGYGKHVDQLIQQASRALHQALAAGKE